MISTLEKPTTKPTPTRKPVNRTKPKKISPVEKKVTFTEELDKLIVAKVKEVLLTTPFYHDPYTARLIDMTGPSWPPHPVYPTDEYSIVVEAIDDKGNFDLTQVQEYLEDLAEGQKVLSGQMTREELLTKWGMADEAAPASLS